MLHVTIDGRPVELPAGATILGALEELGIHVPHLCHDDRLAPAAVCRLCLVEVGGALHPVASCATRLEDGMVIQTHTQRLEEGRRETLELLAQKYPVNVSPSGTESSFLRELRAYNLVPGGAAPADVAPANPSAARKGEEEAASEPYLVDESHPYLRVDMSRCIECFRCERICREVQGQSTWRVVGRGEGTRLRLDSGTTMLDSSCVSCGACSDTCPTGAIEDRTLRERGAPSSWTRTTCSYCGVGCELQVGTREGRIVDIRPALDAPVNKGHLCSKGRYAFGFVEAPDRITSPLIRQGGTWVPVSWDEALGYIAERLRRIRIAGGPDSIGVLGSARATNEDNYLIQKFARVVLGTNNVDCCARVCHAPSAAALGTMLGTGAATSSFDDIERTRTFLVCGSNATSCHPIVGARIRQAAFRGAKLIVVDPRRTELATQADLHLAPRPGTDLLVFHAMAHVLFEEHLLDEDFVGKRVDGVDELRGLVARWSPERVAPLAGVDADAIRRAARLYAGGGPALSFHGLGLTEHVQGTETVMALVNLALLTGNVGRPGAGVNPLRGQNNVQGSAHMGCEPRHLPGYAPLADTERFERVWGATVPTRAGLDLMEMLDAAREGRVRALWAIGYDIQLTNPQVERTRQALAALDLLVVQDMFLNETARELATVFLPVAASFEKEGTFMNGERRVQRVRRAVAPPPGVRADWEIVCALAQAMGHSDGFSHRSAEEIWDEVRAVWPAGAGMSYARLSPRGLQWPCPSVDHPGTALLHTNGFPHGERARLAAVEPRPLAEEVTAGYPLLLITGRHPQQFNAGTMTGRTGHAVLRPRDTLDVSPEDVRRLLLVEGDRVRLESRHGEATLPVHVEPAMRPGELFATFHTAEVFLNRLTGTAVDPITHTPEYKRTAVRLSVIHHRSSSDGRLSDTSVPRALDDP